MSGQPSAGAPDSLRAGQIETPDGVSWFAPVPGPPEGLWLEGRNGDQAAVRDRISLLVPVLQALLASVQEARHWGRELERRDEEIALLYTISDILGQTIELPEAARIILLAVSEVVGARRASILGVDRERRYLHPIATRGFTLDEQRRVEVTDEQSIAAGVFRTRRSAAGTAPPGTGARGEGTGYRESAYLSVPICYSAPGSEGGEGSRCVGVINLTDRVDQSEFSPEQRRLVEAIAKQIGAALENARLVARARDQQRLRNELDLARQLQLKLLPSPSVLEGDATAAVRCVAAESVGGDFYTFARLGKGRVGVMVGDVSSHGLSAALVMALVLAAAGIHSTATVPPDQTLHALRRSLAGKLSSTDTYFTVFYGMLNPRAGILTYANAGHAHAFQLPVAGDPIRLAATSPPLGLAAEAPMERREVPWGRGDLLCLWTDGLTDAANAAGDRFGEARILHLLSTHRQETPESIVSAIFAEVDRFSSSPHDDRTLLVLRI